MRIVIDEDIPRELAPLFGGPGLEVLHVEDLGFKGMRNGDLLTALSTTCDVFITGDTKLQYQQNLARYDLAIVVLHPHRLVISQIKPLIPLAIASFATAPRHAVTTIGADELRTIERGTISKRELPGTE